MYTCIFTYEVDVLIHIFAMNLETHLYAVVIHMETLNSLAQCFHHYMPT